MVDEVSAVTEVPAQGTVEADANASAAQESGSAPVVEKAEKAAETGDELSLTEKTQLRFDKLTRDKYEALRRADQLEYRLQELESRLKEAPKAEVAPPSAPTLESVGYDEAKYQAAIVEFARAEARAAALSEIQAQTQRQAAQAKASEWDKRQAEFAKAQPEYVEKVLSNRDLPISSAMAEVIRESEVGPEVALWLANNPEKAQSIAALPATQAAREIGRIEARIEVDRARPVQKPVVSQAPPPPAKLDATEPSTKVDLVADAEKLSDAEWTRRRNLQEQRRRENRNRA